MISELQSEIVIIFDGLHSFQINVNVRPVTSKKNSSPRQINDKRDIGELIFREAS